MGSGHQRLYPFLKKIFLKKFTLFLVFIKRIEKVKMFTSRSRSEPYQPWFLFRLRSYEVFSVYYFIKLYKYKIRHKKLQENQ